MQLAVEIRGEYVELPTYEVGPENPNPLFTERLGARPYPYRLQNRLTGKRSIRRHEAVILENEYLRLTFLPDFGCRLFSAYDKLLEREVFYRNDCIKPALIAIRGAWISGGVEFNFPIGHAVYTHSRIPHMTRANFDGSASMIFGLTEQMTGMSFTVEVTLVPGEYRFSQHVRLHNGTSEPHRHYWWTNAAVQETPETRMIYPMRRGYQGGETVNWPIHEGVDLSRVTNHRSSCDVFAAETYDEFFGVYHHDRGCGVAHWASQEELPGRKMFFWGQDEMGRLWQQMLTKNAGDYLEIQAGRFATQGDFDILEPNELVEFTEFWIPVAKTEGFVKAHKAGVINVLDGRVAIQLTTSVEGRIVFSDGRTIDQSFEPGEVYWFEAPTDNLTVRIFDGDGLILIYDPVTHEKTQDIIPRARATSPTFGTPEALPYPPLCIEGFQEDMNEAARHWELGEIEDARKIIEAWREAKPPRDPLFDALAQELGCPTPECRADAPGIVQCFAHGDALLKLLEKRTDPQSQVHLGNLLYARGQADGAIERWQKARKAGIRDHIPYRNLALAHWEYASTAYRFMKEASDVCPTDADTLRDLDILAERAEAYEDRPGIAERILEYTPDDSQCLERAIRVFLEVGRLDEAVELLTTKQFFVAELAYQTRILYVRALLMRGTRLFHEGRYEESAADFRRATEYPANLGASRFHDSSDAQAFYLLGLALEKLGRPDEAREAWTKAAEDTPVPETEQAYYVGKARERLGRADAKEAFDVMRPAGDRPDSPQALARWHYLNGDFEEARRVESVDPVKMHNYLESLSHTRSQGRRIPIAVWWTIEAETP